MEPARAPTDAILRGGRRLGSRGLISAGEGNISVRLDDDRLLITPAGLRKDELTADDLVVVWLGPPGPGGHSRSRPPADVGPGHPPGGPWRPPRNRRDGPRPPAGRDEPDPRRRGPRSDRPARDRAVPAPPAVPVARDARQRAPRRAHRGGADRAPGAARERRAPRAPRCLRGRRRCRPGGRPARARRGAVPNVARCAFDPRSERGKRIVGAPWPRIRSRRDRERTQISGRIARHVHFHDDRLHVDPGVPFRPKPAADLLVVPFSFGLGLLAAIFAFGASPAAISTRPSRSR